MDYVIAIPSLKRSNLLKSKTYNLLKKHNIPDNIIYIFVIDNEYEVYKKEFPDCNIVVGRFSAKNNKNYINQYFKEDTFILQLDDDIKDLYEAPDINTLLPLTNLNNFVSDSIKLLKNSNAKLLGVYPIKNPGFMWRNKNHISECLTYCCGALLLIQNCHQCLRNYNLIEDYEYSLRHFVKYGKVLRNNLICVEANTYTLPGGLQYNNNRNKENKLIEIKKLKNEYPDLIRIVLKKNNQPDIRFLNKKNELVNDTLTNIPEKQEVEESPELYTYYYGDTKIDKYYLKCIQSWIKLEYNVKLLTNIKIKDLPSEVECIPVEVDEDLLPAQQADIVRFTFLKDNPGKTWIDLDMFLVKKIPDLPNIISSEQPNRKGAFKTDKTNTPNIGVLKLQNTEIFKEVLEKSKKLKDNSKVSCYMKIFQNLLTKHDLLKYVVHWSMFCPLDWSNVKEAFSGKPLKSKYGKEILDIDEIKTNKDIIGVHLWSSHIRKYDIKGHSLNSFIAFLFK